MARPVEELDEDTLKAIASSTVAPEYGALDNLLKDFEAVRFWCGSLTGFASASGPKPFLVSFHLEFLDEEGRPPEHDRPGKQPY